MTRPTFDPAMLAHVAKLARLRLSPDEIERLGDELGKIVDYVGVLEKVALDAAANPTGESVALREDEPRPSLRHDAFAAEAPEMEQGAFVVPAFRGAT